MLGGPAPLTEIEVLSAALVLKARHAERHETTGRFVPKPTPTHGPEPDMFDGAQTNGIESGNGNPVDAANPAFLVVASRHSGASLLT